VTAAPTGFLGLSHLGIVSSIGWASLGSPVIAVDLEREPVERLGRGELPVHEPGLPEAFAAARERMRFSTDPAALAECALVIVSRDVPTDAGNGSDTSAVLRLVDAAIPHLHPGAVLALMSQVPPGFTRALGARIEARRPGLGLRLHYWVETLIFGSAVERFLKPERIIVGAADSGRPLPPELAEGLARFGCPVLPMRYESAELTKTAINLYLFGAVTYANTLADLCEEVGADWSEMAPALRLDRRIGASAYIRPGLGVAGGNLERDLVTLRALCDAHGVDAAYIETLIQYNARRYRWVHRQLERRVLAETARPVVAVWGLAYKKNTRSTKNSMALRVIGDLRGRAEIRAYDPLVRASEVDVPATVLTDRDATLAGADCLLVLTDWEEFAAPPRDAFKAMRRPLVIDCVGIVDPARAGLEGVEYVSIGRAAAGKPGGGPAAP
jgi:UDPglucose 6-dehydrogenase